LTSAGAFCEVSEARPTGEGMPSNAQALTPTTCRIARAGLSWKQSKLAAEAHVSVDTVRAFEQGTMRSHLNHAAALLNAPESGGVVFVSPYDDGRVFLGLRPRDERA
jgi:DNA-binding transcriptional regulator YiaG